MTVLTTSTRNAILTAQSSVTLDRIAPDVYTVSYQVGAEKRSTGHAKRAEALKALTEIRCRTAFEVAGIDGDAAAELARATPANIDWRKYVRTTLRNQAAA